MENPMKKVLFVCSGNTCRSPMACAMFNHLAKERGIDAHAFSAGLFTSDGLPYSANSVEALRENGITLAGASKKITEDMIKGSDYAFGMTYSLSSELLSAFPPLSDKIYRFPVEVPDPFGGDIVTYKKSLSKITEGVERILQFLSTKAEETP